MTANRSGVLHANCSRPSESRIVSSKRDSNIQKDRPITMASTASDETSSWKWIFYGNIIVPTGNPFHSSESESDPHTLWLGPGLLLYLDHVLCVNHDGIIVRLEHRQNISPYKHHPGLVELSAHEFLCPGFIDLHIHAPQYAYSGTGTFLARKIAGITFKTLTLTFTCL
jgi:hypothetical protein